MHLHLKTNKQNLCKEKKMQKKHARTATGLCSTAQIFHNEHQAMQMQIDQGLYSMQCFL